MEEKFNTEEWKKAFEAAEVNPSNEVWTQVELDLERSRGSRLKRNLILFQGLAAASLLFAMSVAGMYFFGDAPDSDPVPIAAQIPSVPAPNQNDQSKRNMEATDIARERTNSAEVPSPSGEPMTRFRDDRHRTPLTGTPHPSSQSETLAGGAQKQDYQLHPVTLAVKAKQVKDFNRVPTLTIKKEAEPDAGQVLLAQLKAEEEKYKREDQRKSKADNLWTSVGVSAGSFDPNVPSATTAAALGGASSSPESGASYSLGVQVGGKLSRRLILQGGLSYLSQNATYTSSAVSVQANASRASLNEFADNAVDVVAASPYDVNSNLQYLSVPLQVGYVVLDRAFAIQVSGGVATDFFLQNTLDPQAGDIDKVTQQAGEESPYRTVNFSGLVGTEFSYRLGEHYRISVNPGLRYALQSMYKSEVSADVAPITYDIALRFKYVFN